jgi:hypothetical protein
MRLTGLGDVMMQAVPLSSMYLCASSAITLAVSNIIEIGPNPLW